MKNKIGLTILLLLILFLPAVAKAGFLDLDISEFVVEGLQKLINLWVNIVGGTLVTLAGSIVNYVYGFPEFVTAPVVQVGWTITRDLANMTFILGMLAIAFATILRMDIFGFNLKKTLPKLIAMALLLNFSLVICGAIIDVGNSLGRFFIAGGQARETGISNIYKNDIGANIMAAVAAGQIGQLRNKVSIETASTNLLVGPLLQLIFYVILAFLLFAMAFIMIFRIVHLWLLIIMAPLAWVCSFLPSMESYYTKWWSKFLQWAFIPATMGFFIFLGLITGATFMSSDFTRTTDVGGAWEKVLPETPIAAIMQFIVVVFILFMGLATAQRWSLSGASTMMKFAESGKKWAMGKMTGAVKAIPGTAVKLADRFTGGAVSKKIDSGIERLETVPGVGRMIGGPGARFQRQQKLLKDAEGKLKGLRPQDLRAILNQVAITPEGQARRAGALSQLADKGQLKDEDKKYIGDFQAAGGNIKDLLERRLDWAFDEMIQGMMAKDFNFPAVQTAWKKVADEASGSTKRFQEAAKAIQNLIPKKPEDLANLQKDAIDEEANRRAGGTGAHQRRIKELIAEEFREINSTTGQAGRLYGASLNSMINKNPAAFQELIEYLKQPQVLGTLRDDVQNTIKFKPFFQTMTAQQAPTPPPTPPAQPAPAGGGATTP